MNQVGREVGSVLQQRNTQTIIYSRLLNDYPDKKLKDNAGPGDKKIISG